MIIKACLQTDSVGGGDGGGGDGGGGDGGYCPQGLMTCQSSIGPGEGSVSRFPNLPIFARVKGWVWTLEINTATCLFFQIRHAT